MKNRLEELRKQRNIKQEELAEALEVSRQTIGSLENGRYNPSIILAFKIARYFMGNQRIIAGNAQFAGIAAGRGVRFTTGLLLLGKGLGMRETPIRPHSWH